MAFLASRVKDFYKDAMIVACPFCQTRFLVAASLFAAGPRQMVCAKCKHGWRADVPPAGEMATTNGVTVMVDATPEVKSSLPSSPAAIPDYAPLFPPAVKRIIQTALIGAGSVLLLWFVIDRQNIAKDLAFMEPFYDTIGLHIYHTGEGLNIHGVRSELVYEDGIMKLSVEGKIMNITEKTQQIPPLKASAIGSDGHVMQDWQIDAPAAKVDPGQDVPFRSNINAPKGTVVDINLNFIEIIPDASP